MPRCRRHDCALVSIDVIELGPRALLGLAHAHRFTREKLCDLSIAVVKISGNDGVLRTNHHARRLQSHLCAMRAEVASGRRTLVGININGIVRTGLHAGFASNAAFRTEIDDAVFALVHRRNWTDGHARRILAMIAARHLKDAPSVGKCSFLHILHPSAVHGEGNMILRLAGHGAGMTADALAVVDDESISHPEFFFGRATETGRAAWVL